MRQEPFTKMNIHKTTKQDMDWTLTRDERKNNETKANRNENEN